MVVCSVGEGLLLPLAKFGAAIRLVLSLDLLWHDDEPEGGEIFSFRS